MTRFAAAWIVATLGWLDCLITAAMHDEPTWLLVIYSGTAAISITNLLVALWVGEPEPRVLVLTPRHATIEAPEDE